MVQKSTMSRTPSTSTQEIQMDIFDNPTSQGKYAKRKSRFKRSDGSTSSDTTSNSFVRQWNNMVAPWRGILYSSTSSVLSVSYVRRWSVYPCHKSSCLPLVVE